jgi:energy-coupling factor transport system permease protein
MESRGFARTRGVPVKGTLPLMLVSSLAATFGVFLLLSTDLRLLSVLLLLGGVSGVLLGLRSAESRLNVTRHRPHPWSFRDTLIALSGVFAALIVFSAGGDWGIGWLLASDALHPSTDPLAWPELTWVMFVVVALVLAPLPLSRTRPPVATESTRNDTRVRSLRPRRRRTPELVGR